MAIAYLPLFGAAVGALLSSSLPKLYEAVGNLEDPNRVEELDQELRHINCCIKDILENCKDMSSLQKAQVERMRLLVYDIEDLIDSKDTLSRLQLSAKIKKISGRVTNLKEELKSFDGEESTSSKPQQGTSRASTSTSPALGEAGNDAPMDQEEIRQQHLQLKVMKERVEDVRDLVRWSETTLSEKKPKVISIVGFGGIGKSLLAHEVYDGVQEEYPVRNFVQVGKRDKEELLKQIRMKFLESKEELLKQQDKKVKGKGKAVVVSDGPDVASPCSSQSRRSDEKKPRYFVVIDDVMEEQLGKRILSVLQSVFLAEDGGMTVAITVLLTTSVLSVAEGCKSDHVYEMRPLNVADSKNLFMHVAGIEMPITAHQEELMEEIRMKCDGLPLALVCVAKFCGTNIVDRWKEACRVLGSPTERRELDLARMQRVLDHSYTSLSSQPLQASLLYFCMFPHGHPVRKGSIIRRWLAEGPEVDCGTSAGGQPTGPMANAKQCFKTLVGRNVIWPHQDDVKTWKPPGFMLEYIKGMSGMLKFIMLSSPDNDKPQHIRRLSLHNTGVCDGEQVLRKDLSRLRTLAVFRKTDGVANLGFTKCKKLRLLDLENCNGLVDSHVHEICEQLRLLKYLSLGASITRIGRDMRHLKRLETLDLGKQTVVKVPVEVIMLPELKHLLGKVKLLTNYGPIRSDTKSSNVKKCLEESKLETLAGFVIAKSKGFPQLMRRLKNLKKVKIWCDPSFSTRNVEDVVASIREFLARGVTMSEVTSSLSIDFQEISTVPILDELVAGEDPPKKRSWWRGRRTSHQADGPPSQQNPRIGGLASLKLKGFAQLSTAPAFLSNLDFIYELCLSSRDLTWKDLLEVVSNLHTLKYLKVVEVGGKVLMRQDNSEVDGKDKEDNSATKVPMRKDNSEVDGKDKEDNSATKVPMRKDNSEVDGKDKEDNSATKVLMPKDNSEVDGKDKEDNSEVDGKDNEDNTTTEVVMQQDKLQRLERMCLVTNRKLPSFVIEDGALKSLVSLHLTSEHLVGEGSFKITFLKKLKEVALHYKDGSSDEKEAWKKVAREHPNTPQVLVIQTEAPN